MNFYLYDLSWKYIKVFYFDMTFVQNYQWSTASDFIHIFINKINKFNL